MFALVLMSASVVSDDVLLVFVLWFVLVYDLTCCTVMCVLVCDLI